MAGAGQGGAELFYERLVGASRAAGDVVLPVMRRGFGREARVGGVGLAFGGGLDWVTPVRLGGMLRRFAPEVVVAWMGRAARVTPLGDWTLVGRLGGYYDLGRFRRCAYLAANTRGLVRWIEGQGWPGARVRYLPNFVPDLGGAEAAALPGARRVLAMGRLHRNKGFDVLVRAMRAVDAELVIAGEGPERGALEALARRGAQGGRVHFLGWRGDAEALLAGCDVLAVPSRQEPLGNVVIEGWSAGRPVVAAAAAGPAELIRAGEDGMLVPVEDAAALAGTISAVLGAPGLGARLAAAGRARFEAEFAEAVVVAQWRAGLMAMRAG